MTAGSQFAMYVRDGQQAIRLHPDFPDGIDLETAASDMIASILHAVYDVRSEEPKDYDPETLLDRAFRCCQGDQEDREEQ